MQNGRIFIRKEVEGCIQASRRLSDRVYVLLFSCTTEGVFFVVESSLKSMWLCLRPLNLFRVPKDMMSNKTYLESTIQDAKNSHYN